MGVHPVFSSPIVALGSTARQNTHTVRPEDGPLGETGTIDVTTKNCSETPESNTQ